MKKYIYLLVVISICFITCKKEVSNYTASDSLVIGNYTKVSVKKINFTLEGSYNQPATKDVDIDGDGIADIRFVSEVWGSMGLGMHPRSSVTSINPNCKVSVITSTDTSFINYDTVVSYDTVTSRVGIEYYKKYTCRRIDVKDSINAISANQPHISSKWIGDCIIKTDSFKLANFYLVDDGTYFWPSSPTYSHDTMFFNHAIYDYTCHNLPSDVIFFIGIKLKTATTEKLGWIKLKVSNQKTITIYESAIQI